MLSQRSDSRGHWPRGKRRNPDAIDTSQFVESLISSGQATIARIANICGVDPRTVGRWRTGKHWPPLALIERLIRKLWPDAYVRGGLADIASWQGHTPLVGQYTLRAAAGVLIKDAAATAGGPITDRDTTRIERWLGANDER